MFNFNGKTPKEIIFNGKSLSKLLFNGIEVWRKSLLPDGYILCDYLESTGIQYIDLGYHPNQDTKVETNVNILSHNVTAINYLFGVYDSTRSFAVYYSNSSYGWGVLCGTVDNNANVKYQKNIKQKVEFDRNNLFINGTSIYTVASTTTFTSTKTMYLFWGNGTSNRQSISRVYDFKIYENGNLIMDLIPCLDNNGIPCMYDTISGKTFYNKGTGTFKFKIKVQIPDGYTLCDYLESTGTQYIDTGINPDQNTKVECVANWAFSVTSSNQNPTLYGARSNLNSFYEVLQGAGNTIYYQYGSTSPNTTGTTIFGNKVKYLTDSNKFYINDTLKITAKDSTFTNNQSMCIFGLNNQGTVGRFSLAKMYYFKVYDNGVLVQYLVPCLDNNGVPCMYDVISKQSFYNQGTGEFKWSINATYLQLKDFVEGFVNTSTGVVAPNSTYPRAISSPLVLFEKGKTYKVTSNLSATKTDDGVRFRIYGTDDTYKQSIGASQITTNAYATFEALDTAGKANFYVAKDVLITPKQDFKARIMYIDSNYISEFKLEEI